MTSWFRDLRAGVSDKKTLALEKESLQKQVDEQRALFTKDKVAQTLIDADPVTVKKFLDNEYKQVLASKSEVDEFKRLKSELEFFNRLHNIGKENVADEEPYFFNIVSFVVCVLPLLLFGVGLGIITIWLVNNGPSLISQFNRDVGTQNLALDFSKVTVLFVGGMVIVSFLTIAQFVFHLSGSVEDNL